MSTCLTCEIPLPAKSLKWRCDPCAAAAEREARMLSTWQTLKDGKCRRCGKPRGRNGTKNHCRPCATLANAYALERRRRLLAEGRCANCRVEHTSGFTLCAPCAENEAANRRKRRRA
jgi:hypothetical protein